MDVANSSRRDRLNRNRLKLGSPISIAPLCALIFVLSVCIAFAGCSGASTASSGNNTPKPSITSFSASPTSISSGASSTVSWSASGATTIAITPGSFTSSSAGGSTSVSPTSTTTYTLTATNAAGSSTATATVTVTSGGGGSLTITTTSCSAGTQGSAYEGCTIVATGAL